MDRHISKVCDPIVNISKDVAGESSHDQYGNVSNHMLPYSSTIPTLGDDDDDYFQNIFGVYSSFHTQPIVRDEVRMQSSHDISKNVGESSHDHGNVSNPMLPYSSTIPTLGDDDDDYFQNTFCVYSSFQNQPIVRDEEIVVEGASQELERKQKEHKPKQKRCGKMHTISERRRRERIRVKIQALKELIPNCNKWDEASILDDAINYIKSLKLQAEMMAMARAALFQVPYMSPAGIQSQQVTQFSPFMHMRPDPGMSGMCFSPAGLPFMPGTWAHLQMPFYHPQLPVPAATPTPTWDPNSI